MTGANRLLIGAVWPLLVILNWMRTRAPSIALAPVNVIEIAFLLLPTIYAFVILWRDRIGIFDAVVLIAIYGVYLRQVSGLRNGEQESEEEDEPGLAAALKHLPRAKQYALMAGLTVVAAVVIFFSAEPFAEAIVASGRALHFNEFLLIQWIAPLASEAPAVTVAILFVLSLRPAAGLTTMISDKVNQWTLLVGMLPLAMSVGGGGLLALPLDARQHEEFFLTAAQSLFGIALLLRLRLGLAGASALLLLFFAQVGLALANRADEARTIVTLTWLGWSYMVLTGVVVLFNLNRLGSLGQILFRGRSQSSKRAPDIRTTGPSAG